VLQITNDELRITSGVATFPLFEGARGRFLFLQLTASLYFAKVRNLPPDT